MSSNTNEVLNIIMERLSKLEESKLQPPFVEKTLEGNTKIVEGNTNKQKKNSRSEKQIEAYRKNFSKRWDNKSKKKVDNSSSIYDDIC